MEFKLKNKVKLIDDDTVLLKKLLERLQNAEREFTEDIAIKMTDEQYHELCHQIFLLGDPGDSNDLVYHEDGEIHINGAHDNSMNYKKEILAAYFEANSYCWSIYCSTMDALKALEND